MLEVKRTVLLVVLFGIFAAPLTAAASIDSDSYSVEYGSKATVEMSCGGSCPSGYYELRGCGDQFIEDFYPSPNSDHSFEVPDKVSCDFGSDNDIKLYYSEESDNKGTVEDTATLNVNAFDMNPHKGKYLLIAANIGKSDLRHFYLSNDCNLAPCSDTYSGDTVEHGAIVLERDSDAVDGSDKDMVIEEGVDSAGFTWSHPFVATTGDSIDEVVKPCTSSGDPSTHDACDVIEQSFTRSIGRDLKSPDNSGGGANDDFPHNLDSWSPLHEKGNYYPEGDIIAGHEPAYYTDGGSNYNSRSKPQYYICREGNKGPSGSGKVVNTNTTKNPRLYKCDTGSTTFTGPDGNTNDAETNDWDPVAECDDGLDNDGDGSTGHSDGDPGCSSPSDNNEADSPDTSCTPNIKVTEEPNVQVIARWGGGTVGDGTGACQGGSGNQALLSDFDSFKDPETFTCEKGFDQEICDETKRAYDDHDDDTSLRGSQIKAVKYYPEGDSYIKAVIPEGSHSLEIDNNFNKKMVNRFVDSEGWKPGYMALDAGDQGAESQGLYLQTSDDSKKHDGTGYWFASKDDGGLQMVDGDSNGYQDGSYEDSWKISNAGNHKEDVSPATFPGGFYGKCQEDEQWIKDSDDGTWRCSGSDSPDCTDSNPAYECRDWDQHVVMPKVSYTGDYSNVGFFIMPYLFRNQSYSNKNDEFTTLGLKEYDKQFADESIEPPNTFWDNVYKNREYGDFDSTDKRLVNLNAGCWPSQDGFTPEFKSSKRGVTHFNVTILDINGKADRPIPVYGNLTMLDNSSVSCSWHYETGDPSINTVNQSGKLLTWGPGDTEFNDAWQKAYKFPDKSYGFPDDLTMREDVFTETAGQWKGQSYDGSYVQDDGS